MADLTSHTNVAGLTSQTNVAGLTMEKYRYYIDAAGSHTNIALSLSGTAGNFHDHD